MSTKTSASTAVKPWTRRLVWSLIGLVAALTWCVSWQHTREADNTNTPVSVRNTRSKPERFVEQRGTKPRGNKTTADQTAIMDAHSRNDKIPHEKAFTQDAKERPHSHPIDDTRRRIYRENNLNVALMGAMNVGDYLGLRALIEEYRTEYPEDEHQLQEGYSIVADCLERLTAERQKDARDYWQHNRASTVRRFIRRHCLEKPVVGG